MVVTAFSRKSTNKMSRPIVASFLGVFLLVASCCAEKAPYTSFVKDATLSPQVVYYDYIITGGGTAGCSLAATLSTAAKVLVLERGGLPYGIPAIKKSGVVLNLADISPTSASQLFVTTDGVFSQRGRVLGGTSAINGGFYSRASDQDVRENGWDPQLVIDSYQWIERRLVYESHVDEWQVAVRDGLLEAGVAPNRGFTYEHLNGTKVGGSIFDENERRHGAADLLEYANATNIVVYLHATVHRVLFETVEGRLKAHGVSFVDSKGIQHEAYLDNKPANEIILSAGAIGSPQLLLLSGIGPAQELKALGIDVILDQPMVGLGMSDNPINTIIVPSPKPIELSFPGVVGITESGNYIEGSSGLIELNMTHIAEEFAQSVNQEIKLFNRILNESIRDLSLNPNQDMNPNTQIGLIMQKVATIYSRGSLKLQTRDPEDNPRVTFNYYQDKRDLLKCVQGMKITEKVFESHSFSKFRPPFTSFQTMKKLVLLTPINLRRKHLASTYSMEQFCIDTVTSSRHYHGGCQVGSVVDHDYKVIGVDSMRVIDASTFVNSPGSNPQATIMMLGRYMGKKILHEQGIH